MAASAWAFYDSFKAELLDEGHNLATDTLKVALFTNTYAPNTATNTTYAGISANEISGTNGYTTGGDAVTGTTTANNFDTTDASWTASGGSITARYGVLYNVTTGGLIGYITLDATPIDVTVTDTNTLTIQMSGSGIFDLV